MGRNSDSMDVSIKTETEENHGICRLCKRVRLIMWQLTTFWWLYSFVETNELYIMFEGGSRGLLEDIISVFSCEDYSNVLRTGVNFTEIWTWYAFPNEPPIQSLYAALICSSSLWLQKGVWHWAKIVKWRQICSLVGTATMKCSLVHVKENELTFPLKNALSVNIHTFRSLLTYFMEQGHSWEAS